MWRAINQGEYMMECCRESNTWSNVSGSQMQHIFPQSRTCPAAIGCLVIPPHDSRRVTSAATTRGLSQRPWRLCGGVRCLQVHSMGINTMWISHGFRRAPVRKRWNNRQSNCWDATAPWFAAKLSRFCFNCMSPTQFQTVLSADLSLPPALNSLQPWTTPLRFSD